MGTLLGLLLFTVVQVPATEATDEIGAADVETFEIARLLAGPRVATVPIVLVSARPRDASSDAEAWTLRQPSGDADRIAVYTKSEVFQCANRRPRSRQCLLKLASIITHEAWHLRNGPSETGAYDAQLAFLIFHEAPPETVTGVRLARERILVAERRAREEAWRRHRAGSR
jgi:hypothetical protein